MRLCTKGTITTIVVVQAMVILMMIPLTPSLAQTIPCEELTNLIEESRDGFLEIRGEDKSEFGGFKATAILPGAHYCVVIEDPEKKS